MLCAFMTHDIIHTIGMRAAAAAFDSADAKDVRARHAQKMRARLYHAPPCTNAAGVQRCLKILAILII